MSSQVQPCCLGELLNGSAGVVGASVACHRPVDAADDRVELRRVGRQVEGFHLRVGLQEPPCGTIILTKTHSSRQFDLCQNNSTADTSEIMALYHF